MKATLALIAAATLAAASILATARIDSIEPAIEGGLIFTAAPGSTFNGHPAWYVVTPLDLIDLGRAMATPAPCEMRATDGRLIMDDC
jgi:hypothetical protein